MSSYFNVAMIIAKLIPVYKIWSVFSTRLDSLAHVIHYSREGTASSVGQMKRKEAEHGRELRQKSYQ